MGEREDQIKRRIPLAESTGKRRGILLESLRVKTKKEKDNERGKSEKSWESWGIEGSKGRGGRIAAGTASVSEKKRIGNYPWIVRKCSKGSTARTSEPSGKWTMETVGKAAMARRLYKRPQSKISRSFCFFHESRVRSSLFIEGKCPAEWHLDQIFLCRTMSVTTSATLSPPTYQITFLRLT